MQNEEEKVIVNYSKTLSKDERNYCTTRKELLAIIAAVRHFHHFLCGRQFIVRTDHRALKWQLNFKKPEGQLIRWLEMLGAEDFVIEHRPGRKHLSADTLSRPCTDCKHCERTEQTEISETEE